MVVFRVVGVRGVEVIRGMDIWVLVIRGEYLGGWMSRGVNIRGVDVRGADIWGVDVLDLVILAGDSRRGSYPGGESSGVGVRIRWE